MVSRGRTHPRYRYGGRFFGRRVNCEHVPMLPAQVVAGMLDDPRKIPYLLVWKSRLNGTAREAVRIAACNDKNCPDALYWLAGVEIKRHDGTCNFIRTMLCRLLRQRRKCPPANLPLLRHSAPGTVRMGAGRTLHFDSHAINLGMS